MKKRVIAFILTMCLCFSMAGTAMAVENDTIGQHEFALDNNDFADLSGAELGKAKLLASGHSEGFINSMPDETLAKIATSEGGIQTEKYMTEIFTEEGTDLVEATAEDYERKINSPKIIDPQSITVVDENGEVLFSGVSPTEVIKNVDGGTVKVLTTMYRVEDKNHPSHFMVVSEFQWTTMPSYRGTDYFGITRDNWISIYPGTFGNYYAYVSDLYRYLATNGGVLSALETSETVEKNGLPNEDATNPTKGFAIEIDVPGDAPPPASMLVGTTSFGRYNYALTGGCYFEGVVAQEGVTPTNFNIWTTYQHQDSTIWFNSPSISVPIGASITVSPTSSYSEAVVDMVLATWG